MDDRVKVDPQMIEWYRQAVQKLRFPDESSTDDGTEEGPPIFKGTLDILVEISETGRFASPIQERDYNEAVLLYENLIKNRRVNDSKQP